MTHAPVPPELASACADTTTGGPADVIGGHPARYVAAPASTGEAAALLRAAAGLGLTVVPRGAGRLQHWGHPPDSCDLIVDTRRLNQVVEHRVSDFTVTVQAGMPASALEQELEAAGQTLRLIPPRQGRDGTIGGAVAVNAPGLLRYRYGTPRDHVTGVTAVRADGLILRTTDTAAGRDRARLFAGSYGTLGLITEVTLRLHPLARGSAGVGITCADPAEAERIVGIVTADPWLAATGINLFWPAAGEPIRIVVSLEHDSDDYQDRVDRLHVLAGRTPPPPVDRARAVRLDAPDHGGLPPALARELLAHRDRLRAERDNPPPETGTLLRASFPAPRLARALAVIAAAAVASEIPAAVSGSAGSGVLDVTAPAETPPAVAARFIAVLRRELDRVVVVYAPGAVRELTDMRGPVPSPAVTEAIKDKYDPEHRMAPGRLAEAP